MHIALVAWCNNNGVLGQRIILEWTGLDENENPLSMDNVARASMKKVKWRCNKGHEWFAKISSRTSARTCCPYCSPIGTSYTCKRVHTINQTSIERRELAAYIHLEKFHGNFNIPILKFIRNGVTVGIGINASQDLWIKS